MPIWTSVVTGGWYKQGVIPASHSSEMPHGDGAGWGRRDTVWHSARGTCRVNRAMRRLMEAITKINIVLIEHKCIICKAKYIWNTGLNPGHWKDSIIPPCRWLRWWRLKEVGNGQPAQGRSSRHRYGWKSTLSPNICCQQTPLKPVSVSILWCWATFQVTSHNYSMCSSGKGWWGRAEDVISRDNLQG